MTIDNPASRLSNILSEGLKIKNETPCRKAWEQIFSIQPNNNSDLFILLGKAMQLPGEVVQLVSLHFPHQTESVALWKDPIDVAFLNQNILSNWQSFRQHINPYCIAHLNLISDLLHTKIHANAIDDKEIELLFKSFSALIDDLTTTQLPETLKLYLVTELAVLLQLLRQYRVTGTEPILRQADSMFGHIVRNQEYRSFLADETLGQRLLDNLTAMANLMTVATGLPQLTVAITRLLN